MNQFEIKDTGATKWLHKIAKFGGWRYYNKITDEPNDFCYWVRRILWGLFWIVVILCIIGVIWAASSVGLYKEHLMARDWAQWIKYTVAVLGPPAILTCVLGAIFLFFGGLAYFFDKVVTPWQDERKEQKRAAYAAKKLDPNLATGWDAFKNKYCIKMNVAKRHR